MSNIPYTLGLDIGMASVGAALLTESRILALHVRTFDKAETAKEGESLNKIRRDSRLTRRRIRRRAFRLLRLRRLFKRIGLLAENTTESFITPTQDTWQLRADGLDRKLSHSEWAAVLYHIVKHRGFQSNRKSEAKADEKAGQMLTGVSKNKARMQEKGWRSIGEMAAKDSTFAECKRNKGGDYSHTFSRADLAAELELLFEQQRGFGNAHAGAEVEKQVHELLMARKPTLSGDNLLKMVGKCTFEPSEFRAPKASYRAERFVWIGKLNNLKISFSGDSRSLTETERNALINMPFTQSKLTFKQVRKALNLPEHARFNLISYRFDPKGDDPEKAVFFEAKNYHKIKKAYEDAGLKTLWQRDALDPDRLDTLAYAMTCFKDDTEARLWLQSKQIEPELIEAALELSFDQFIQLSQKALIKLLPFMGQGQRYDEAAVSAGYHHSQTMGEVERSRFLPAPDKNTIINPVVYRALNQARKLVNAIVREYGPPIAVNIELARDLSKPFDERKKIEKAQKEFQEEKASVRQDYSKMFGAEPKALDLQKWRLYREQNGQCAYSQQSIDLNRLQEPGYVEVDHALPYSRSYDDSQNNKVLVLTRENRNKANRTPYEYLDGASNSERWQSFEAWVQTTKSLRQAKRNRLLRRNFGQEEASEFRDRNLNDTRYICREFKKMVETHLAWHPAAEGKERCVVVAGQLTALLRARWGLPKVREEGDLHHALDAAVIAAANRKMVKRMADYSKRKELAQVRGDYFDPETSEVVDIDAVRNIEAHFPEPWAHFRQELLGRLSPDPASAMAGLTDESPETLRPVRVSRAPTRRGLGQAHQETIRSVGKEGKLLAQGLSAIKTPLTNLTLKDLPNIVGAERDTKLIEVLRERLDQFGGDGKKAFADNQPSVFKPSKEGRVAPRIRSVKLLTTQKSGIPIRHGIAANGAMLRVDIFSKAGKFHAVPAYVADAARGELPNRAVIAFKPEEEWTLIDDSFQFMFSLYPNDWLSIQIKESFIHGYFAGFDRSTGAASLWAHDRSKSAGKDGLYRGIGIKTAKNLIKCHVDFLGRVHRVHHEERGPLPSMKRK
jgi:CRISPR-associated endonuclease Csn1